MTTQLEKGDVAGARCAADSIADADSFLGSKADLLEKIARRQAAQGDAAGVLAWAGQQRLPKAKLQSLRGMADGSPRAPQAKPKPPASAPAPKPAG